MGRSESLITPEAFDGMIRRKWAGNVRELEQSIRRALVTSDEGRPITSSLLFPETVERSAEVAGRAGLSFTGGGSEGERCNIEALGACRWTRSKAA